MFVKKIFLFLLPVFCLLSVDASAQVVTSKKKAVEKGIYRKPDQGQVSKDVTNVISSFTDEPVTKKNEPKKPVKIAANTSNSSAKTSAKNQTKTSKKSYLIKQSDDADIIPEDDASENYLALQMINNAMSFIGTRYMGGGTTRAGMDCSGMVTAVLNIFDLKLPRSSNEMAKYGDRIERSEIRKGDLIFFKTNGRRVINHVGLVIEVNDDEIKFVHSSTSKGVIVSSTKEAYYQKSYAQANRIM